jgi:apolipoprotein D and lipocalin family protein
MGNSASSSLPPLQTVSTVETAKFMGTWFVIAVKPTMLEKTCSNAVERYSFLQKGAKHDIDIDFQYNNKEPIDSPLKSLPQKGWIQGLRKEQSGEWKVSPLWPIKMPYLIIECDEHYEHCVIGFPSREYCWIMNRSPIMADATYQKLTKQLEEKHQYNLEGLRKVPQVWTKAERDKRGLTKEIPDALLTDK